MNKKEEIIDLNIVILPSRVVSEQLIKWSTLLNARFETAYTLNTTDKLPHFSLYSARYPTRNKDVVMQTLEDVLSDFHSFNVTLSDFSVFSGYIFYDAVLNENLQSLHERLVDTMNPLREGHISDNQKTLTGLTMEQKRAIQEYGYVSVKKLYMPHISVTKLQNLEDAGNAVAMLPKKESVLEVSRIAIAPFAQYGTCPQPLKEFIVK